MDEFIVQEAAEAGAQTIGDGELQSFTKSPGLRLHQTAREASLHPSHQAGKAAQRSAPQCGTRFHPKIGLRATVVRTELREESQAAARSNHPHLREARGSFNLQLDAPSSRERHS